MNEIDLKGRTAIVTGGAQGIGFAIASRLLRSGAAVSIWDRDTDTLLKAATQLHGSGGSGRVTTATVDVTDAEAVERAAETIAKELTDRHTGCERRHCGSKSQALGVPDRCVEEVIDINLSGIFYCCRAIVPYMIRAKLWAHRERCVHRG